jgi:hypothetical protein
MTDPKVVHPATENRIDFRNHDFDGPADIEDGPYSQPFFSWPCVALFTFSTLSKRYSPDSCRQERLRYSQIPFRPGR